MTTINEIIVAGAIAEGHGAIVGWSGLGTLSRARIIAALAATGLPADWAPAAKSTIAHAGRSLRALKHRGYVVRRARRGTEMTTWDARWIVFRADASGAKVGDVAGEVVLSVELHGDDLLLVGDLELGELVRVAYVARRDAELYSAGDVTGWVRRLLYRECGATAFGVGYYIPQPGRERATRIVSAVAGEASWGAGWINPLLPVATSDELRIGIARGLVDDVRGVSRSLESARAQAQREKRADVTPATAARLLGELAKIHERVVAYRLLCGDAIIAGPVAEIAALRQTLGSLTDDASLRFAMLDLNDAAEPARQPEPVASSPAERAADVALAARRASAPVVPSRLTRGPAPAPVEQAKVESALEKLEKSDAEQRFSLIELD